MAGKVAWYRQIGRMWRTWVVILTPLVFLPLPILTNSKAGKCAYALAIMAIYWMTEAIPMAATALLPIGLMPLLGVIGAKPLAKNYLKDTNMLFFGGLLVAVAVERWNLHKRIALRVLMLVGSKPRWLMFGFMITTAFLSMWISNTATTAMMIPIVQAVLNELDANRLRKLNVNDDPTEKTALQEKEDLYNKNQTDTDPDNNYKLEMEEIHPDMITKSSAKQRTYSPEEIEQSNQQFSDLRKGLTLCVAYAANIGGTATLTGTGPNLVIKGLADQMYGSAHGINFSSWFVYAFTNMSVCLVLAWFWLQIMFLGCRTLLGCFFKAEEDDGTASEVIKREYAKMGPMTFAEGMVLVHFVSLAVLWLTREPEFVPGWSVLFEEGYVTDASIAIFIGILLFMAPSRRPNFLCFHKADDEEEPGPAPAILDWETVHKKMAWNVILLLGGGFALADSCQTSGLSQVIGNLFISFTTIPLWILICILCTITATFTEITSNVATATIFLPILANLAESIYVNPLYFMVPVTVATSFAFMLPVATPPNALVFAYGHMKIIDMVKCGIVMNIICIIVVTFSINTWGYAYYDFGTFPAWAGEGPPTGNMTDALLNSTMATLIDTTSV